AAFAAQSAETRERLRLVLAGAASPQALAAVEALVASEPGIRVELIPNVPEERKRELLRTGLFFCSPSRFGGWGIAALEANAAGKPVLVTRADGCLDSIKDGFSGVMIPVGDEKSLMSALGKLIQDAALRAELGRNARIWASRFTWDEIA